jgi:hypothetical protein
MQLKIYLFAPKKGSPKVSVSPKELKGSGVRVAGHKCGGGDSLKAPQQTTSQADPGGFWRTVFRVMDRLARQGAPPGEEGRERRRRPALPERQVRA